MTGTKEAAALAEAARYLRTPAAIRERCGRILEIGLRGELPHFRVHREPLAAVADYVAEETRANYPDLRIPVHSRFGHFDAGRVDRNGELNRALSGSTLDERVRAKLDLVVVSVLLDAGSGPDWKYVESGGGVYARSEGLAVASFRMFMEGNFAADAKATPLRADGLSALSIEELARGFQAGPENHLVGVDGRRELLHALSRAIARPGDLLDVIRAKARGDEVLAADVLAAVLETLGPIWPGRVILGGVNLGDVWPHSSLAGADAPPHERLVPFHKLSQWLTYSLLPPLEEAGLRVTRLDDLTGLPEYRNGGLFLDLGALELKDASQSTNAHPASSELVVEWRALTVALLDELAPLVRSRLEMSADDLPLASLLQGGTWSAGRKIAAARRPGGAPPLKVESDGTVF
jgi:hypothetical protein